MLDGGGTGTVLVLSAPGVAANFVVDGLTLQQGNVVGNSGGGTFILTNGGSVSLRYNIIQYNCSSPSSDSSGGGEFLQNMLTLSLYKITR